MSPANPAIVDRNRRAVHHALTNTFLAPESIASAMGIWEAQFAQQAGFRISLYATAVAAEMSLDDMEIRELASNLYASMTMTENRLPQLPASLAAQNGHVVATGTHPKIPNPRIAVFAKLVDAMIDGAAREKKFDELVEAMTLNDVTLPEEVARQRMVWINRRLADSSAFAARIPEASWRAVVNDLYVASCEACGPVVADRHLAQAVQIAEQAAEARMFSPRTLL